MENADYGPTNILMITRPGTFYGRYPRVLNAFPFIYLGTRAGAVATDDYDVEAEEVRGQLIRSHGGTSRLYSLYFSPGAQGGRGDLFVWVCLPGWMAVRCRIEVYPKSLCGNDYC